MEIFKGGKPENTSGYSDAEGAKIEAFVLKAHAFFTEQGKNMDPGMLCDAILVAAAQSIGGGFRNKEAFDRNVGRLTANFSRVMTHTFVKRLAQKG